MLVDVLNGWIDDNGAGIKTWRLYLVCGHKAEVFISGTPDYFRMPGAAWCIKCDEQRKTKEVSDGR